MQKYFQIPNKARETFFHPKIGEYYWTCSDVVEEDQTEHPNNGNDDEFCGSAIPTHAVACSNGNF